MEEKKKRKKRQFTFLVQEQVESQTFHELVKALEKLAKEGKYMDVQICPRCKSPRVRRVGTMSGNLWGHMGIFPHRYECKECGWSERLVLKTTNKPTSIKDAEIIAEASDSEREKDTIP
jgi:transposase-like protein